MSPRFEQERSAAEVDFWNEVRKRRNHCFWWAAMWPVLAIPLVLLYSSVLPDSIPTIVPGMAALLTWGAFSYWLGERFARLKCFSCGKQAFTHALFFMKHARCKNCGIEYER